MCVLDDAAAVETRATELAAEIAKAKSQQPAAGTKRRRQPKKPDSGAVASEREIALVLGSRPPIPKHLEETQKVHQKASKESKLHRAAGQRSLENSVTETIKRNIFPVTPEVTPQGNGLLSYYELVGKQVLSSKVI